ncbi:cation:proton antiporter [Cerasicoccus frondis]|uniref:cation:proton antiporter n=1 Tax=Cerasicoccus frondis TaxID=490090 RepID=UPI0028528D49|nr:sodium:proton antiporter [Cerasicoccus frondis]
MEELIVLAACLLFGYGLISRKASTWPISGPMLFAAAGLLASPLALDLFDLEMSSEIVTLVAEITLIVILFCDASTLNLGALKKEYRIPARLLGIGLPLTMALGAVIAYFMFPSQGVWLAAILAFILSPTDAALGQAVVTNKAVPQKIRDSIGVESGLNDGIALPAIMACMAAVAATGESLDLSYWLSFATKQVLFGPVVGAAIGFVGGWLIEFADRKGWADAIFERLGSIALAIICYSLAELLGGNGFIAAFFGGLFLGARAPKIRERMQEFGEAEAQQLSLLVFLIFGVSMVPASVEYWSWTALIYAILSLTIIRLLPVLISLIGTGMDWSTKLFIGWFGPRGIASVLYLLIFIEELGHEDYREMLAVIVLTVLLSIVLHGISAVPLVKRYSRTHTAAKPAHTA